MLSTCYHCHAKLGTNDALEVLPIGRRIAYDGERGRVWVICTKCARWNLTPFEERWEALEQAERLYRGTRARVSTDNIALAKVADGTELVRIGRPLRPEFAAWRYGRALLRRRRLRTGARAAGVAAIGTGVVAVGVAFPPSLAVLKAGSVAAFAAAVALGRLRTVVHVRDATAGRVYRSTDDAVRHAVLVHDDGQARLTLRVRDGTLATEAGGRWTRLAGALFVERTVHLYDDDASAALRVLLPHLDAGNGATLDLRDALAWLDQQAERRGPRAHTDDGTLAAVLQGLADERSVAFEHAIGLGTFGRTRSALGGMRAAALIGTEMALAEEDERRVMQGELGALHERWRDAEEVARIADGLLVPSTITERVRDGAARDDAASVKRTNGTVAASIADGEPDAPR